MNDKTCIWTYDDYYGYYDSACGDGFYLTHEWDKKFKFCPYCGGRISLASENEPASEGESCK
jgi:rRNA maturation endonuclease Nob1